MGSGMSNQAPQENEPDNDKSSFKVADHERWRNDKEFEADGTLVFSERPEYQELRNMLDEPIGRRHLGTFAEKEHSEEMFRAWFEIEDFRTIPTPDYRRCEARHIYNKYIRDGAVKQLGNLTAATVEKFKKLIVDEKCANLKPVSFTALQHVIFRELVENTFLRFKKSDAFAAYKSEKEKTYNRVHTDDFVYLKMLGEGAFGKVVCVRKKSTGKYYAMKILDKEGLVSLHDGMKGTKAEKLERINVERNVIARSRFPFIVTMDYAFQNDKSLMLAMELLVGGDLTGYLKSAPNKRLSEDEVRLISAEIALALRHLHCLNYVYRDLKPDNVLLTGDGHVKLADMGLVARIDEDEMGGKDKTMKRNMMSLADNREFGGQSMLSVEKMETPVGRRKSLCGTFGFRAPEQLILGIKEEKERSRLAAAIAEDFALDDSNVPSVDLHLGEGYGSSVDWWALGCVVFEMIGGRRWILAQGDVPLSDAPQHELVCIMDTSGNKKKGSFRTRI